MGILGFDLEPEEEIKIGLGRLGIRAGGSLTVLTTETSSIAIGLGSGVVLALEACFWR